MTLELSHVSLKRSALGVALLASILTALAIEPSTGLASGSCNRNPSPGFGNCGGFVPTVDGYTVCSKVSVSTGATYKIQTRIDTSPYTVTGPWDRYWNGGNYTCIGLPLPPTVQTTQVSNRGSTVANYTWYSY